VEPFVFSIFFLFFFFPVPSLSQARFILQQTTWIILKQQSYNWALSQAPLVGLQNFGMLSFFVKVKVVHSLTFIRFVQFTFVLPKFFYSIHPTKTIHLENFRYVSSCDK
jgi:hypothetical protein